MHYREINHASTNFVSFPDKLYTRDDTDGVSRSDDGFSPTWHQKASELNEHRNICGGTSDLRHFHTCCRRRDYLSNYRFSSRLSKQKEREKILRVHILPSFLTNLASAMLLNQRCRRKNCRWLKFVIKMARNAWNRRRSIISSFSFRLKARKCDLRRWHCSDYLAGLSSTLHNHQIFVSRLANSN